MTDGLHSWPADGLFERVNSKIKSQIERIEDMTGDMDPKTNFALIVIQTELERYKFLVRSYLRTRIAKVGLSLASIGPAHDKPHMTAPLLNFSHPLTSSSPIKIDKHTLHYLSTETLRQRLSPTELAYATRHQALLHNHYLSSFLSSFPQRLQNLNDTAGNVSMIDAPDLDTAVFVRLLRDKDVFGRGTDVDTILPAANGDVLILRWSSAKGLVEDGDAELV